MKMHLILLLLLTGTISKAQNKALPADSLIINFYPSFMSASKLIITRTNKLSELHLQLKSPGQNDGYPNHFNKLPKNATDSLWLFLKTYNFKIKNNVDTTGSYKGLDEKGDSTVIYKITVGLDGISVYGAFKAESQRNFSFWSPKQGTENNKLMILVFDLMNKAFKNESYIERLSRYFSISKKTK